METVKKIAKYGVNILAIVNALLVGLDPIWGIPYCDKIKKSDPFGIRLFYFILVNIKPICSRGA